MPLNINERDNGMEDELKELKERLLASPEKLAAEILDLPYELVEILAADTEFRPVVEAAIFKTGGPGKPGQPGTLTPAELAEIVKARQEETQRAEDEKKFSLLTRISRLDVGSKAKLARNGDKDSRTILIKDANKLVSMAVLANPKLTIQEVEVLAASRNVSDEVLRVIARNQDWCKSYTVIFNLTNNPKTPVAISLTYLPRLITRDLRLLAKSKGVPEIIRTTAKRHNDKRQF